MSRRPWVIRLIPKGLELINIGYVLRNRHTKSFIFVAHVVETFVLRDLREIKNLISGWRHRAIIVMNA